LAVIYGYTKIFDFMALLVPWKSWTLSTCKCHINFESSFSMNF
jgi:hypothetical protein